MTWLEAARVAGAVAIVGVLVLVLVFLLVQAVRAEFYRSRGYKVTHPPWFEGVFGEGDGLVKVEVPEDFVTEHEWLDAGLKFERRGDAKEKTAVSCRARRS